MPSVNPKLKKSAPPRSVSQLASGVAIWPPRPSVPDLVPIAIRENGRTCCFFEFFAGGVTGTVATAAAAGAASASFTDDDTPAAAIIVGALAICSTGFDEVAEAAWAIPA